MALLAISVGSAWLVTDVKAGGSTGINFADSNRPATSAPPAGGNQNGGNSGGNASPAKPKPAPKPSAPANVPLPEVPPDAAAANTEFGPITDADRDVLTKAHQAALWQRPTALDAAKRGNSSVVRDAAKRVAAEQTIIDAKAVQMAGQLKVTLPDKPTAEQSGWMTELAGKRGAEFDKLLVNRFRSAQAKLFPLVSEVRSTTQNSVVRAFTQTASTSVLRAMTFMDNTGLVGFGDPAGTGSDTGAAPDPGNGGSAQPSAAPSAPDDGSLLPGDALPGEENTPAPAPANPGGNGNGNNPGNGNSAPNADLPSLPSDPQAGAAQNAPGLAKASNANWFGGGGMNLYLILGMIGIAVMISLIALRGFSRR